MKVGYGRSEYACDQVMMLMASVTEGSSKAVESADSQVALRANLGQPHDLFFFAFLPQLWVCFS